MRQGLAVGVAVLAGIALTASAAFAIPYAGTGYLNGFFQTQDYRGFDITYTGPMTLGFDSMSYEQSPGHWATAYDLDLLTSNLVDWEEVAPGHPTGSGTGHLGTEGWAYPVGGGPGGVGALYAPLVVSIGGVGTVGGHVFALTDLTNVGTHLTLDGWVAHDVFSTHLTFGFQGDEVSAIPEPSCILLVGAGLAGMVGAFIRRRV